MINNVKIVIAEEPRFSMLRSTASIIHIKRYLRFFVKAKIDGLLVFYFL